MYAVLTTYLVWVLSLPLFPSQDGPVHLYYTEVAKSLYRQDGSFASAFIIKHALPPYSLHSYLLMLFTEKLSALGAEKCLVCICIAACGLGFRALAARFGASAWATSLLVLPFCFHRYLFLGFYNYSLALGVLFFALSVWFDPKLDHSSVRSVLFCLLGAVLTFTHPLGIAALLLIAGLDLLFRISQSVWRERLSARNAAAAAGRRLILLGVSSLSIIYVARFLLVFHATRDAADVASEPYPFGVFQGWKRLIGTNTISPVLSVPVRLTLFAIAGIAGAAFVADSWPRWRVRRFRESDVLFGFAVLLAVAYPFLPYSVNGSLEFNVRLTLFCPFLILAAASGVRMRYAAAVGTAGVVLGISFLAAVNSRVAPIAREVAQLENVDAPHTAATLGLDPTSARREDLTFDAYYWNSARLARRTKSVLRNGPWLEIEVIMLGRRRREDFAQAFAEDPRQFLTYMNRGPNERARFLMGDTLLVLAGCGPIANSARPEWLYRETTPLLGNATVGCSQLYRWGAKRP